MKTLLLFVLLLLCAQPVAASESFTYDFLRDAVPLPPEERSLPSVRAEKFLEITPERHTLEGVIFNHKGELIFCNPTSGEIIKMGPDKELQTLVHLEDFAPSGLAQHKDGRLFFTALNLAKGQGQILALGTDGKKLETILPVSAGYLPNDLVFDQAGGFYFTDFRGSSTVPSGGVYYVSPDFSSIAQVLPNLSQANGVALSPDGKILWVTEYAANRLHRLVLEDVVKIPPTGSKVPYTFTGAAPDSMRTDQDGNVYVAMVGLGKVMIFNPYGLPIGQVLLPEREQGINLRCTSLAIHPETRELYIVAGNTPEAKRAEAGIFKGPSFAPGLLSTR